MSKYDEQQKLKVVLDYLSGQIGGFRAVGQAHGTDEATVRKWGAGAAAHGRQLRYCLPCSRACSATSCRCGGLLPYLTFAVQLISPSGNACMMSVV